MTISLGDTQNTAHQSQQQAKRRLTAMSHDGTTSSGQTLVRNRSKSEGIREEFEREEPHVASSRHLQFFSSLLRRGNEFIASSLSSLGSLPGHGPASGTHKTSPRPEDIFEPDTRREMELLAKENEDRMISRIHHELEKDEAVYRPMALSKDSEELRIAEKVESLFNEASLRFSIGTRIPLLLSIITYQEGLHHPLLQVRSSILKKSTDSTC